MRRAVAAATAIVDAGGTHDRTREAADFLVAQTFREPDAARHMLREARALVAHVLDYERWTRVLAQMDTRRFYGPTGESSAPDLDRFFEELASGSENPDRAGDGAVLRGVRADAVPSRANRSAGNSVWGWCQRDQRTQQRGRGKIREQACPKLGSAIAVRPHPGYWFRFPVVTLDRD